MTSLRKFSLKLNRRSEKTCPQFHYLRKWENEIINSPGNTPDIEEKHDNGNINNKATYKGERLESKFVSSNAINLSRKNLSEAEISLLSKGLKFVPTANKIDRAK